MTARRTIQIFRLWAAVLLAVIGMQAMVPVQAPLQRETGSAFSAATSDVALASARRGDTAQVEAVPVPPTAGVRPQVRSLPRAVSFVPAEHLRPGVRGPPPRHSAERVPDLRGPPLA
jgi:hypothetical protein